MKTRIISFILIFTIIFSSIPAYASTTHKSPFVSARYTHASRFDGDRIRNGIDVSEWQGSNINWKKVKESGVQYVIVRVGYRKVRGGQLREDKYWKRNIEGALNAGLNVGVYFFSQAVTTSEAKAEADYIIKRIKKYDITLPVIIDFEFGNGYRINRLMHKSAKQKQKNTDIISSFCNRVNSKGYDAMVYANLSTLNGYMYPQKFLDKGYKIWCAQYAKKCDFSKDYSSWQYTSGGRVKGISGRVDCNYWYGDSDMFSSGLGKVSNIHKTDCTKDSVTLTWNPMYNIIGYNIYRSSSYDGNYEIIASTVDAKFTDTGLEPGRKYFYRVEAFDSESPGKVSDKYTASTMSLYDRYGVANTSVNLRKYPGESFELAGSFSSGTEFTVCSKTYDKEGNLWYYAKTGSSKGYVRADYIDIKAKKVTTITEASILQNAGSGATLGAVPADERLEILDIKEVNGIKWYRISYIFDDIEVTGWISSDFGKGVNV